MSTTRGAAGRAAFAATFKSPQEKQAHFRELAIKGNAERLVLTSAEREKLVSAYKFLGEIAKRHGLAEGEGGNG